MDDCGIARVCYRSNNRYSVKSRSAVEIADVNCSVSAVCSLKAPRTPASGRGSRAGFGDSPKRSFSSNSFENGAAGCAFGDDLAEFESNMKIETLHIGMKV